MSGERAKPRPAVRFPLALEDIQRKSQAQASAEAAPRAGSAAAALAAARAKPAGALKAGKTPSHAQPHGKPAAKPATGPAGKPANLPVAQPASRGTAKPVAQAAAQPPVKAAAKPSAQHLPAKPQTVVALAKPAERTDKGGAPQVALSGVSGGALALTSERIRERMVERLRANGVSDPRVLGALAAVPRHLFVDPGLAAQAYEDAALPIGHQQTISKPSVVARMIELVARGRTLERVLEIGTGCGYQAAVLSRVAREVYSIERIKPLYERAKLNLRPLRVPNIRLHYGDGRAGLPAAAPFDAIVIAAAGLDVPPALLEQLAIGGRLIAPVGAASGDTQVLTLVERTGPAQWRESRLDRVFFVPLKSGVI